MPRNATTTPAEIMAAPVNAGTVASQGTVIEQTRAVAEVQAMVIVAQQAPRKTAQALEQMRESCAQRALAQRAFFRFPRGGATVTGATVHLARELARCWGNVTYGVTELRRDEIKGISEMQAFAWDVQTNTRNAVVFIVPHIRDKRGGAEAITDMRDIYENNANMGARRVRECIFAVLPMWFTQEAEDLCRATLAGNNGGKTLAQQVTDATGAFAALGVTVDQLETKLGVTRDRWTGPDIAQLEIIYASIQRREVTVKDEFPPRRTTTGDVLGTKERDWAAEVAMADGNRDALESLSAAAFEANAPEDAINAIADALAGAGA
ncbi:hypothetical protein SCMU_14590 [Sinomonas cyclohexanicum]|uniref:Uncharacterized protein n=1 Tax=Sinomonas cyclohexanicum TaxID=322009 RepID=A0ABM7PTX3_SINCY|nr:hypothetical protein [Corynebacterium cyclohexanicum]BCT75617.1 hypothetical protein SCMU_14590 [Corynebacterium cyclohexanicum]